MARRAGTGKGAPRGVGAPGAGGRPGVPVVAGRTEVILGGTRVDPRRAGAAVDDKRGRGLPLWPVRGLSSAGRAPALQAGGHRFDPGRLHFRKP